MTLQGKGAPFGNATVRNIFNFFRFLLNCSSSHFQMVVVVVTISCVSDHRKKKITDTQEKLKTSRKTSRKPSSSFWSCYLDAFDLD